MGEVDLGGLRELAVGVAREAGAVQLERLHFERVVEAKSSPTDAVTEVDRECEALIVSRILEGRPRDTIVGEEGADRAGTSGVTWFIDPLDGTVNYLYRRGGFAVSIGVEVDGVPSIGVVYDPSRDEVFSAVRGEGASLNGAPIRVSAVGDLSMALLGTGFGYDSEVRREQGAVLARLLPQVRDVRRAGSAALDLCAVACGRLDAYYERGLQRWDSAAASVIVREAGGVAEQLEGPGWLAGAWVAGGPSVQPLLRGAVVEAVREVGLA